MGKTWWVALKCAKSLSMTTCASAVTAARLATAVAEHPHHQMGSLPGRTNHLPGAVLVPVVLGDPVRCIVTIRPLGMRVHGGEVVFPGGRPEPGDADLQATALRETREELGLEGIEVVGALSSVPLYTSDFRLHPFVGVVPPDATMCPNPAEVESVHHLSISEHLSREHLHGIPFRMPGEGRYFSPVFEVAGRLMFGGTAHAFHELLVIVARILGKDVPPMRSGRYQWCDILPPHISEPT
jgi:8-oxo-dGTP pyrophosphatase MutT (NUDIX family)